MKTLTGLALLIGLAACNTRGNQESGRVAADTTVTARQTQDTTIVTSDTSVRVDTVKREGNSATKRDTVKR
jgi:hypothetical protein